MVELTVIRNIGASVDAVWAVLDDYGNLSWIPGADNVEVIGEGVGMTRRLHMPGLDSPIDETLTAKDIAAKTFSYTIPKNAVIPFDDYNATVSVTGDTGSATVNWYCSFDQGDVPEEDAKSMIEGSYTMMLDALADKLET
ncbi:MAG: SRPBCC family protein [Pseudomonadota bacterium]|nr:SRPBCC family protein [Pseudomonadota bacterium]